MHLGQPIAFHAVLKVALDYQQKHPRTLVSVTADHGHTSQIIPPPTNAAQPGVFSKLTTADGTDMTVSYATSPVGASQEHTGTEVRVAAQGPRAANVVGVIDQTELYSIIVDVLRLKD